MQSSGSIVKMKQVEGAEEDEDRDERIIWKVDEAEQMHGGKGQGESGIKSWEDQ